jgi:hypothetical protein
MNLFDNDLHLHVNLIKVGANTNRPPSAGTSICRKAGARVTTRTPAQAADQPPPEHKQACNAGP